MTLWAHVYCGYASYDGAHKWSDDDHVAHKFVQILKGEPANGYAWLPHPNGGKVKISTILSASAFNVWGIWAAARVKQLYPSGALLVPIPAKGCLKIGADPKGRALAAEVAGRASNSEAVDALHWRKPLVKAREGGPRDVETLFANLGVLTGLAKRPVVLIDDVITGGGHALACARALRQTGHEVGHVIAAAHTIKSPPGDGMFKITSWDLEADPFADW